MHFEEIEDGVSGVYIITCTKNNKSYIGVSKNIKNRWKQHVKMLHEKTHHSIKLQEDYNTYGDDFFEFKTLQITDYGNAKKLEDTYIKMYKSDINGYNVESYLDNTTRRDKMWRSSILEYTKNTYVPDGNMYCYDIFKIAKYLNMSVSDFLKDMGVNTHHKFNVCRYLNNTTVIGINWTANNIFAVITDERLFGINSDLIAVDVEI